MGPRQYSFKVYLSNLEECHILRVRVNHQCADLPRLCWILHKKQQLYSHEQIVERSNQTVIEWTLELQVLVSGGLHQFLALAEI